MLKVKDLLLVALKSENYVRQKYLHYTFGGQILWRSRCTKQNILK